MWSQPFALFSLLTRPGPKVHSRTPALRNHSLMPRVHRVQTSESRSERGASDARRVQMRSRMHTIRIISLLIRPGPKVHSRARAPIGTEQTMDGAQRRHRSDWIGIPSGVVLVGEGRHYV